MIGHWAFIRTGVWEIACSLKIDPKFNVSIAHLRYSGIATLKTKVILFTPSGLPSQGFTDNTFIPSFALALLGGWQLRTRKLRKLQPGSQCTTILSDIMKIEFISGMPRSADGFSFKLTKAMKEWAEKKHSVFSKKKKKKKNRTGNPVNWTELSSQFAPDWTMKSFQEGERLFRAHFDIKLWRILILKLWRAEIDANTILVARIALFSHLHLSRMIS